MRRNRTVQPSTALMGIARETAVAVAEGAIAAIAEGRWGESKHRDQAYLLATQTLVLEAELV